MNLPRSSNTKDQCIRILFLFVIVCLQSAYLSAQSEDDLVVITTKNDQQFKGHILGEENGKIVLVLKSTGDVISLLEFNVQSVNVVRDKFVFKKGRYHRKKGWVNSVGLNAGNILIQFFPVYLKPPITSMIDYKVYKLIHPNIGLGLGVDHKQISTPQLGYEYYSYYKFADVFAYGKIYLGDERRRLFLDAKLGYGYALENEIVFGCPYCDDPLPLAQRYTSGRMLQFGGGLEFASKRRFKWGINWAILANRTLLEEDEYPEDGRTPIDGVIKFSSKKTDLAGLMLGVNFYL